MKMIRQVQVIGGLLMRSAKPMQLHCSHAVCGFLRPSIVTTMTARFPLSTTTCAATLKELHHPDLKTQSLLEKAEAANIEESNANGGKILGQYLLPHPIWTPEEVTKVEITHREPEGWNDKTAYFMVQAMRKGFDIVSGYTVGKHFQTLDERSVIIRCIFLETVAGIPGFTAAMLRHLTSLRMMQRDHGWIHTLLEEAENERIHLLTFLTLRNPGHLFRAAVKFTQYTFTAAFFVAYLISPKFCHRFVGYLEEEAVKTYTSILEDIDTGRLPMFKKLPAPQLAVEYWQLPEDADMREVMLAIRADEAHHRLVNHTLASINSKQKNPFKAME